MKPYLERVIEEKQELDEKLTKLVVFRDTEQFSVLSANEQGRLSWQQSIMEAYSKVLSERIKAFFPPA